MLAGEALHLAGIIFHDIIVAISVLARFIAGILYVCISPRAW